MRREETEGSGEEGTKYRKEPSACPICGKVRGDGERQPPTQLQIGA